MSSGDLGLPQNGHSSQLGFQNESLRFNCGGPRPQHCVGDSGPKTRELTSFIEDRFFTPQSSDFRQSMYNESSDNRDPQEPRNWNPNGVKRTPRSDSDDDDDDDDDEDDDDDDDDDDADEGKAHVGGLVGVSDSRNKGIAINNGSTGEDKIGNGKIKHQSQLHSSFGSSEYVLVKEHGGIGHQLVNINTSASPSDPQPGRFGSYGNAVIVAEPDNGPRYSEHFPGPEGSGSAQNHAVVENGCGFSGRKDVIHSSEPGDSLRAIFSDPVTGALMDDAMILPCGHSFGGGGIEHVVRMKACYTCSQSISDDSIAPNLSLRTAVQAFRREEDIQCHGSSKRRRERRDQEKGGYGESALLDTPRGRGVQFPFVVTDRVIIKGNKRTPERFVGREAVVTTQCLNGWYVVKTLDKAESVKLQYRSLAKVSGDRSSKPISSKMTPNSWL